jgi:L-serine dehydratase
MNVNGFSTGFNADLHTLIITAEDRRGAIAFIANVLANSECNIANMSVNRKGKSDMACHCIEADSGLDKLTIEYLNHLSWVKKVIYIPDIDF